MEAPKTFSMCCCNAALLFDDARTSDIKVILPGNIPLRLHSAILIYHSDLIKERIANGAQEIDLSDCGLNMMAEMFKLIYGIDVPYTRDTLGSILINLLICADYLKTTHMHELLTKLMLLRRPKINSGLEFIICLNLSLEHGTRLAPWLLKEYEYTLENNADVGMFASAAAVDALIRRGKHKVTKQFDLYVRYYRGRDLPAKLARLDYHDVPSSTLETLANSITDADLLGVRIYLNELIRRREAITDSVARKRAKRE